MQPNPGPETLEVECREGLRTQWLSFVYRPEECAAATLGCCRDQAAMSSLDTLCVWPDKGELDLGLSLSPSGGKKAAGNCPCTRVGEQRGQPPKEASDVRGWLVLFRL